MAKIVMSIKIDPAAADDLKQRANREHKTVSDILNEGLFASQKIHELTTANKKLERENQELRRQIQATNRRPTTTKRIAIPLTLEEYDAITNMAAKHHTTRTDVLRQALKGKRKDTPILPQLKKTQPK